MLDGLLSNHSGKQGLRPTMLVRAIIVEDETLTRHALGKLLRDQDWHVWEAGDACACEAVLRDEVLDVAIVDLGLPGKTGLELIETISKIGSIGILAVTAQSHHDLRVATLEAGADDYIVKPYHDGELVARIRAVLRRRKAQLGNVISLEHWEVNLDARTARSKITERNREIKELSLTRGEVSILAVLAEAGGRIVTRERLSKAAARPMHDGDLRTVDTLIYRLRRKFQRDEADNNAFIISVPGLGYRLITARAAAML